MNSGVSNCVDTDKLDKIKVEAVPILVEDIENLTLREAGCEGSYYETWIEYWKYNQDKNELKIKFRNIDDVKVYNVNFDWAMD